MSNIFFESMMSAHVSSFDTHLKLQLQNVTSARIKLPRSLFVLLPLALAQFKPCQFPKTQLLPVSNASLLLILVKLTINSIKAYH